MDRPLKDREQHRNEVFKELMENDLFQLDQNHLSLSEYIEYLQTVNEEREVPQTI